MNEASSREERVEHVFDRARVHKKLRIAAELFRLAYEVKRHQLKSKNPELNERELSHRAYALIERGCTRR